MPALLLSPHLPGYGLPTYPPRPALQRSSSVSSNDSGVIVTPGNSPPTRQVDPCTPAISPMQGFRTFSVSSERAASPSCEADGPSPHHRGDSLPAVSSLPVLAPAPVTVIKSQPIVMPGLHAFPINDNTPAPATASSQKKFFEIFDAEDPASRPERSVSRGRSAKRPLAWPSPISSTPSSSCTVELQTEEEEPIPELKSFSTSASPIPTPCSLLMGPDKTPPPTIPTLIPPILPQPSGILPTTRKFEALPRITLPPPPSASVIPTLSPTTILNGLGYQGHNHNPLPSSPKLIPRPDLYQRRSNNGSPASSNQTSNGGSKYYFHDGNVVFQVRDKLYKVHRYFFEQNSLTMTVMISSVLERAALMNRGTASMNVANFPVILHDTDPQDFERLLSIFYPTDYSQHDAQTVEDWTSILRVSSRFGMSKIRSLALDNLYLIANAVEKIALNNEFKFDDIDIEKEWLFDAYVELVTRAEPLTFEEGEKVGMRDVIRVQTIKSALMKDLRKYLDGTKVRMLVEDYM